MLMLSELTVQLHFKLFPQRIVGLGEVRCAANPAEQAVEIKTLNIGEDQRSPAFEESANGRIAMVFASDVSSTLFSILLSALNDLTVTCGEGIAIIAHIPN